MSGGEYGYLYSLGTAERLGKFVEYADRLVDDLMLASRKVGSTFNHEERKNEAVTATPEQVAACVDAAGEVRAIAALVSELDQRIERFSGVLHDIEWWQSYDSTVDSVWSACVAWRHSRPATDTDPQSAALSGAAKNAIEQLEKTLDGMLATLRALGGNR